MDKITIDISTAEIESRVSLATAYVGSRRETVETEGREYMKIATVAEDSRMLSRFLADAVAVAVDVLKGFIVTALHDGGRIRMELETSTGYDAAVTPAVEEGFVQYLAASVTGRWMRLAAPSEASEWEAQARQRLEEIARNLFHRKPPRRKF